LLPVSACAHQKNLLQKQGGDEIRLGARKRKSVSGLKERVTAGGVGK